MLLLRFTLAQEPQEDEKLSETVSVSLPPRERKLEVLRMEQWGWRMLSPRVCQGRVRVAAGQCPSVWHILWHVPPIMGWTPRAGWLPWPAPSAVLKLHPEKQVWHWNSSITSGAQETRAGFKTKRVPESLQGALNVLIKTFSVYLIIHITEKREAFKHLLLCCCCGFTCLQWSHLSLCLPAVRAPHLDMAQGHNCWKIPALPSVVCKVLLPQPHPGDSQSSCPLLISLLCQTILLQRLQMKVRKGG